MKKMMRSLVMTLVLVGALSVSVFPQAQRVTSWGYDFSFGGTTSRDSATMKQHLFPAKVAVTATVVISVKKRTQNSGSPTYGAMSVAPSIPVIVELKSPGFGTSDYTGVSKEVLVGSSSKTITLVGNPNKSGCGAAWTVNVRAVNPDDLTEFTFSGRTTMSFAPAAYQLSIDSSGNFNLPQNNWVDKDLLGNDPDEEGLAEITGEWFSANDPQVPIRMKVEILGVYDAVSQGYPTNETRTGTEYSKLKILKRVYGSLSNYKLRITNTGSGAEAVKINLFIKKFRGC